MTWNGGSIRLQATGAGSEGWHPQPPSRKQEERGEWCEVLNTSPNSITKWGPQSQTSEPVEDILMQTTMENNFILYAVPVEEADEYHCFRSHTAGRPQITWPSSLPANCLRPSSVPPRTSFFLPAVCSCLLL